VRVFGEMVALLAADGNDAAAVRLEALWNDLQRAHPCALLCAYPMACLGGEGRSAFVDEICAVHSAVIPAESFAALATPSERQRAVAALQQKAESLDRAIAERHLVEDRLCDALAAVQIAQTEAGAAHQSRDEFLAIAAHELRNPLTGLSLHAQLALRRLGRDKTLAPEAVAHTLEAITSHAATLARLLDLLTDVSRLEAGDLVLRPRATDLTALVSRVVAAARARVAGREITLAAAPALQARVDPLRVEQVLANLLDNAIKSSPDVGTVDVSLSQPDTDLVELSVRDCGRGMPPETRDSLFERFSQAHSDDVGHGLGLGLYVSRQIVALHGGEIRAEFPPDGGSRFVVHLPVGMPISAPILVAD
jgi:signal transduction histidine kinase